MEPTQMMIIGAVLLALGFVLPFLMLLQYIPSTFLLNFFAYGASLVGLVMGTIGAAMYARRHRK